MCFKIGSTIFIQIISHLISNDWMESKSVLTVHYAIFFHLQTDSDVRQLRLQIEAKIRTKVV